MKASHGGTATHDTLDAQKIAVLLRGGRLPQASVSPAERRATRDLRRRRFPLTRPRAELLTHVQPTNGQYHLPESGQQLAAKAHRDGMAARCPAPAVQKRVEVDRALMASSDQRLSDVEWRLVQTAKPPQAQPLDRLQSVPGIGKLLHVVLLYALHDITRVPRGQEFVSDGRLVKGAKASAGTRAGTSGAKIGKT